MKIVNIRKGFATNSSSSHSILELPLNQKVNEDFDHSDFGWSHFTLTQSSTKEQYLQSCLFISMRQILGLEKTQEYFIKEFGLQLNEYNELDAPDVDHQSQLTFPATWDGKDINSEFLQDFREYLLKENVIILGGNDNTSDNHPLYQENLEILKEIPKEKNSKDWVAKKNNHDWVLFNRASGLKIRMSLENGEIVEKGSTPELADIKITDFCPFACEFCYQDSTLEGKHAKLENIRFIAQEMAKKQVFEVALGGGETTLHPQFKEIVQAFHEKNIVVNFTTKNLLFFKQKIAQEILPMTGAIAFSITSTKEINQVLSTIRHSSLSNDVNLSSYQEKAGRINFQYVMGSTDLNEFKKIMKLLEKEDIRITLLGYKENGRGNDFIPHDYKNWLDVIQKTKALVSIDTALASEFEKELLDLKVKKETFHVKEGGYSLYIDAVKNKMYPSSYIGLEQEFDFDNNWLHHWSSMLVQPVKPKNKMRISSV